mgnify:CR=1 FL=1
MKKAQNAIDKGLFEEEITPVVIKSRKGDKKILEDEQPGKAQLDKIPHLKPAFAANGTVTAANSSSISDGAAAVVVCSENKAKDLGVKPLAKILAHVTHAHEPCWFTTAPVTAIDKLLRLVGWSVEDVDRFEINEAFAVVTMAAMKELNISPDKVNVRGGACALGHPIGASGARIIVTLLASLEEKGLTTGVASLCIGGGEATAMAFERIS